jgi:hypothetical protein
MALYDKQTLAKELINLKMEGDLVSNDRGFSKLCNYANVQKNIKGD